MKTKIIFALFAAVILTGCHFCKPVEESMECFPLCVEKKEDIHILTEERWESFKNFRLIPYVSVGIPLLDNSGRIVEKLSRQITDNTSDCGEQLLLYCITTIKYGINGESTYFYSKVILNVR